MRDQCNMQVFMHPEMSLTVHISGGQTSCEIEFQLLQSAGLAARSKSFAQNHFVHNETETHGRLGAGILLAICILSRPSRHNGIHCHGGSLCTSFGLEICACTAGEASLKSHSGPWVLECCRRGMFCSRKVAACALAPSGGPTVCKLVSQHGCTKCGNDSL